MKSNRSTRRSAPRLCPVCGEDVPRGALACPDCGADHNSGWREDAEIYDGVELGDGGFDYDEFVRNEFGGGTKPRGIKTIWWVTAIVLVIAFVAFYLYSR